MNPVDDMVLPFRYQPYRPLSHGHDEGLDTGALEHAGYTTGNICKMNGGRIPPTTPHIRSYAAFFARALSTADWKLLFVSIGKVEAAAAFGKDTRGTRELFGHGPTIREEGPNIKRRGSLCETHFSPEPLLNVGSSKGFTVATNRRDIFPDDIAINLYCAFTGRTLSASGLAADRRAPLIVHWKGSIFGCQTARDDFVPIHTVTWKCGNIVTDVDLFWRGLWSWLVSP